MTIQTRQGVRAGGARRRIGGTGMLVAGIVLLAFNLRPAITSLPPLFPELATHQRLSPAELSILATIPVLSFGLFSAVAAPLARRFGEERVLGAALLLLSGGLAARGLFPGGALFVATVAAAAAVALMNVLLSGLIKRRLPHRAGLLLGLYLFSLYVGATLGSAISVPLYRATGGSWLVVLGVWGVPALIALVAWLPQIRRRPAAGPIPTVPAGARGADTGRGAARGSGARSPYRSALGWQVAVFMGLQSLTYYATLSWLPTLLRDRGSSAGQAGLLVSMLSVCGLLTALATPMLAQRRRDHRMLVLPAAGLTAVGMAGSLWAPLGSAAVWTGLLGFGQGATLALALYFTIARADAPATVVRLSAMAQCVGYLLAAPGPFTVGLLHDTTGGWAVPFVLLLVLTGLDLVFGLLAGRDRMLREEPARDAAREPATVSGALTAGTVSGAR